MHNSTNPPSQHKPIKTHYTWTISILDQKIIDVLSIYINIYIYIYIYILVVRGNMFRPHCGHLQANLYKSSAFNVRTLWDPIVCKSYSMWNKNTVKSIYWWIKYVKTIDSDCTYTLTLKAKNKSVFIHQ